MLYPWIRYLLILGLFCGHSFASDEHKTLVVTCASGELGSATARTLAKDHNLILTGRNLPILLQLQKELKEAHPHTYEICPLDFSNPSSINQFRDYLNRTTSSLSGLVLITPRPQFYGSTLLQDEDKWLEAIRNTFTGPLGALKAVLPHLSKNSKIVVIAGTTSVQFQAESGPSCVIRRMWSTYTKALSHQLGPQGISINTLSPGVIMTKFHQERIEKKAEKRGLTYEEQLEQEVSSIPLRRHGKPLEVAQTIQFLLSEQSDFINGNNLVLDGGFTVSY